MDGLVGYSHTKQSDKICVPGDMIIFVLKGKCIHSHATFPRNRWNQSCLQPIKNSIITHNEMVY